MTQALIPAPPVEVSERGNKRNDFIASAFERILENDAHNTELTRFMFEADEVLRAAGLSNADIAKVRSWESPRKEVAAGLAMGAERLVAAVKQEQSTTTVNIERAVIQVPAVSQEARRAAAVIIDVEAKER